MNEDFDFEDKDTTEEVIDNEKHWKSLSIASVVILTISTAIIIAIILLTPSSNSAGNLEPYTLSEVITKQVIKGNYFNGTWIADGEFIYQAADKNVLLYNYGTGTATLLTTKLNTTTTEIIALEMSPARDYLLITSKRDTEDTIDENVVCQDVEYQYYVYDLRNGNIINLENEFISRNEKRTKTKEETDDQGHKTATNDGGGGGGRNKATTADATHSCLVLSAEFTPKGNELLIVATNDIYWMDLDFREVVRGATTTDKRNQLVRLTFDGSLEGAVMNGLNDYIYREMIFGRLNSFYWSRDQTNLHLCYISINNSLMPLESMTLYPEDKDSVQRSYRYPNINNAIGQATLWVVDMRDIRSTRTGGGQRQRPKPVRTPEKIRAKEHYITFVDWTENQELVVVWTLRDQKHSTIGLCSAGADGTSWTCVEQVKLRNYLELKHTSHSVVQGDYIKLAGEEEQAARTTSANDISTPPASEYFLCGQVPQSGERTYYQLYSLDINTKVMHTYLNNADLGQYYRVSQLLAYNRQSRLVFFLGQSLSKSGASQETIITEQDMRPNVFVFSLVHGTVACLSCDLDLCHQKRAANPDDICIDVRHPPTSSNSSQDELCFFQSALFSPSAEYASVTCLVGILPRVYIIKFNNNLDGGNNGGGRQERGAKSAAADVIESIILFDDNNHLKQQIESKIIPKTESFIITREYNNQIKYLRMKILAPPDFSDQNWSQYAFLFEFHSGQFPFHESIEHHDQRHEYPNTEWAIHMVTQHQFIYAWLDGHLAEDVNQPMGTESLEELIDDYNAALEYIQANMTFVNQSRSCLLGTNAGASLVLSILSQDSAQISCGIVFSPITNWNHINTVLAEQYLDIERFRAKDPTYLLRIQNDYKQLNKRSMLILHGTTNELVPLSQTIQLMKKLSFTAQHDYVKMESINESDLLGDGSDGHGSQDERGPAYTLSTQQYLVLYINHGSTFDGMLEHLYRKIESFLFSIVTLMH